jgi:hypothetical protein
MDMPTPTTEWISPDQALGLGAYDERWFLATIEPHDKDLHTHPAGVFFCKFNGCWCMNGGERVGDYGTLIAVSPFESPQ